MQDGYYWATHHQPGSDEDGTHFIVKKEGRLWWTLGVERPINETFDEERIICRVEPPRDVVINRVLE